MIGIKVGVGQVFVVKLYDIARERLPISESSLTEIFVRATKVFIFFSGVIRQNRLKHRKYRIRRLLADIRFFGKRLHIAYIFYICNRECLSGNANIIAFGNAVRVLR